MGSVFNVSTNTGKSAPALPTAYLEVGAPKCGAPFVRVEASSVQPWAQLGGGGRSSLRSRVRDEVPSCGGLSWKVGEGVREATGAPRRQAILPGLQAC